VINVPPNSKEAEISLLSSLIIDQSMFHVVSSLVTEEQFYTSKHQKIYRAIAGLVKDEIPVDFVTLADRLRGKVESSDLVGIANYMSTGANAEYYAKVVVDTYVRRKAINSMREAIRKAQEENNEDIKDIIASVQKELDYSMPQKRVNSDLYPVIIDTLEEIIDMPRGGAKNYIPTGFIKIDRNVRLTKGTLTLIAGDPGTGKTSYLLTVGRYMAKHGYRPLLFSLEMTAKQIRQNIIAQELKLCHQDMVSGYLSEVDQEELKKGLTMFSDLNMGVLEGRWTTNQIRYQLITEMRTKGVDCLMIDSLGKVKLPDSMNKVNGKVHDIYNYICEELVDIAVELDIPVVITHHLNKDSGKRGKNNRPTVYSLREAGDMWTHNVVLIYREYTHTRDERVKNLAEFIICKARDGEVGTVDLGFTGPSKTFYEIEEHREPPAVMAGAKQWGN
jgi:replicative DNA helicase